MSAIILSNNSEETNVSEILFRERFVSAIYLGTGTSTGLIELYSDPEDLHHYYISEDTSPNRFTTKTFSSEVSPIEISGKTFEDVEGYLHSGGKTVSYGYIDDTVYTELDFGGTKYRCDISVDDVSASGYNIVIPENTNPYGVLHKITWSSSGLTKVTNEYQTSDEHALFGLESDSKLSIDYASARNYLTKLSGIYTVGQPGTLVFRPLKECQITFINGSGYYYVSEASTINNLHGDLSGTYSITELPQSVEDIEKDPYSTAGFKSLTNTLPMIPGKTYLVGFLGNSSFRFGDLFQVSVDSSEIPSGGGGVYATITASSGASWSVTSSSDWVTINPPSGSGSSTIMIGAGKNTTGAERTSTISVWNSTTGLVEKSFQVSQQPSVTDGITFGSTPSGWSLTENSNGYWVFQEDEAKATTNRTLTNLSFTPSKNGTVTLTGSAGIGTCDETIVGAALATTNAYFNVGNSLPLCAGSEQSASLNVTAGTTYFVQALRDDASTGDSYTISLKISFVAS